MYTHCPKCDTHFEITQEYLDIANGQVRCGNCDHIFDALKNLYNHDTSPETESQAQSSPEAVDTTKAAGTIAADEQERPETAQAEFSKPQSLTGTELSATEKESTKKESTGQIDLKEKMERIVASLSAATQELKNARNSTNFQKPFTDSGFSKATETASENRSFLQNYSTSQTDTLSEKNNSALINNTPEQDASDLINDDPEQDASDLINDDPELDASDLINDDPELDASDLINDDPELDASDLINDDPELDASELINDDPELDANDLIDDDPEQDASDLINDDPEQDASDLINDDPDINDDAFESTDVEQIDDIFRSIDKSKTSPSAGIIRTTQLDDTPETIESVHIDEIEEADDEDELDIVNVVTKDFPETRQPSALDFAANKVDSNDIDVLNGLIDESDRDSSNNELYEKLDELNNSHSDDGPSLDDELSELDDNGELLAELDQLESEFITDKQAVEDDEPTLDDLYESEANDVKHEDTDQITIDNIAGANLPQEEVVPSFLTQSHSTHSSPSTILGWLAATIILLALLFSQYLHFNSVKFAQHPEIRPFLETLCPITGCHLPLIRTPKKIVTVTHNVRTHPNVKNALEIQLTFKNKAAYTQSFPILEITFSNPVGEIVARRRFSPEEYHIDKSQFQQGLKSNQSHEIHLKVVDPDPGALLSFQFNYL